MKRFYSGTIGKFLGWGFVLLAASNIVVLGGVAFNRSGEPECRLVLSERELQTPYSRTKENSGLSLRLVWRVPGESDEENGYRYWRAPAWFDEAKIAELGLDLGANVGGDYDKDLAKKPVQKEVFIVLELDGEPYRQALAQARRALAKEKDIQEKTSANLLKYEENTRKEKLKAAEQRLENERLRSSRLFAVDAGLDSKSLREKYPDRSQYIITKGVVEATASGAPGDKKMRGRITMLLVEDIHVALPHRAPYEVAIVNNKSGAQPDDIQGQSYTVELVYGRHFEPWIASCASN